VSKEVILNLGGEGEFPLAVDVNHPAVLEPNWRCSREGRQFSDIYQPGNLVICCSNHLPFCTECVDKIVINSAPVDYQTHLGPGYSSSEIFRIAKPEAVICSKL
jgi:hypothetical protein